ncbi:MAG: glycosyltransferase [Parvibaculum sp.]|nr:glycosyltransferase [Parvibaculum sp.]
MYLVYGDEFHDDILAKLHPRIHKHFLPTLVRPLRLRADLAATFALWRLCRAVRPDIVHTHTSKAGFVGRVAAFLAGVPVILHGVHILPFLNVGAVQRAVYLVAEKLLVPATDVFVDVSQGMKAECLRYGIGTEATHLVVPSGMDVARFRQAVPVADAEFAAERPAAIAGWAGAEVILMVAAFEERKRQLAFLDVFAGIAAERPHAVLLLGGDGPCRDAIERRISALGLKDRVALIGFREDIERWMKRADVCVLSSEREGLPRVIVQYALAGRPIVSTYLPGIEAVVHEGENGYLTARVEDMAVPITAILSDSVLSQRLSAAAAGLDLSPWGVEEMAGQLDGLYTRLVAAKSAAAR